MPIISRQLSSIQSSISGTVMVVEQAVDDRGREWARGRRRSGSVVQAESEMNAYDWTAQLQHREEDDAAEYVRAGNDPETFTRSDLTAVQLARRLIVRWARLRLEDDKPFMLRVAQWITTKTKNDLATILGVSVPRAQTVLDRANGIVSMKPALDTDDGRVTEDIG